MEQHVVARHGDTGAGAGKDLVPVEDQRLAQDLGQVIREARRLARAGQAVHEDGEGVVAEAREGVSRPQVLRDAVSDFDEELVARFRAQAVVHVAETVQIEEQDRQLLRSVSVGA